MSLFENREKEIIIPGPEGDLQAVIQGPSSTDSAVSEQVFAIVCHPHPLMGGTMNNKVVHTMCRGVRDLGIKNIRFNFRGVERSQGAYAEGVGEVEDLLAIVRWCQDISADARFIIAGFSFGSYVAARSMVELRERKITIDALVLTKR